jgi:hypothetical protein
MGVGMLRLVQDCLDRALLHDAAGIEHGNPVTQCGNDRQIVRDEEQRHLLLNPEAAKQV